MLSRSWQKIQLKKLTPVSPSILRKEFPKKQGLFAFLYLVWFHYVYERIRIRRTLFLFFSFQYFLC